MKIAAGVLLSFFCWKVTAADQIPFLYLNQYYTYNLENPTELVLENKRIDFKKIKINVQEDSLRVSVADQDFILNKSALETRDQKTGAVIERKQYLKSVADYQFKRPAVPALVCFISRTVFSKLTVCKSLTEGVNAEDSPALQVAEQKEVQAQTSVGNEDPLLNDAPSEAEAESSNEAALPMDNQSQTEALFKLNGARVATSGTVVLKNRNEPVMLQAQLTEGHSVQFSTRKRMIYPVRVFKKAGDNFLDIKFVDVEKKQNNAWEQKLEVTDSTFTILLDPLIQVKQDIYFNKARLQSLSIKYQKSQVETDDLKKTYTYKTIAEVFGIYLSLKGENSNLNVTLNSSLGKGLTIVHEWPVLQKYHAQLRGYLYQMDIQSDAQNRVLNGKQSLYGLSGGFQYHLTPTIDLLAEVHLQQDLFFKPHPTVASSVEMYTALNKQVAAISEWTFYRRNFSEAALNAGIHYILPTSGSGVAAKAGLKYQLGASYMHRFSIGQFSVLTEYVRRDQNTDVVTFAEQSLYYGLGYQFLY